MDYAIAEAWREKILLRNLLQGKLKLTPQVYDTKTSCQSETSAKMPINKIAQWSSIYDEAAASRN
jgi:hypothetical protein